MAAPKTSNHQAEYLRIEALYRALDYHREAGTATTAKIIETAETFHDFLRGAAKQKK